MPTSRLHYTDLDVRHSSEDIDITDLNEVVVLNDQRVLSLLKGVNAEHFNRVPALFRRWILAGGNRLRG
jgi:hypothetical protein